MRLTHRMLMTGLVAGLLALPAAAYSSTDIDLQASLGTLHSAYIVTDDQISDGCWLTPSSAHNRVTAKLEQAGITTYDEPLVLYNGFWVLINISGLGYRTENGLCVANLSFSVKTLESRTMGSEEHTGTTWTIGSIPSTLFERQVLLTGGEDLTRRITEAVDSNTDELLTRVYAGRRHSDVADMIEAFEGLTREAMTQREFNQMVENVLSEMRDANQ